MTSSKLRRLDAADSERIGCQGWECDRQADYAEMRTSKLLNGQGVTSFGYYCLVCAARHFPLATLDAAQYQY